MQLDLELISQKISWNWVVGIALYIFEFTQLFWEDIEQKQTQLVKELRTIKLRGLSKSIEDLKLHFCKYLPNNFENSFF